LFVPAASLEVRLNTFNEEQTRERKKNTERKREREREREKERGKESAREKERKRRIGFGRGNPKYITKALYLCT